MLIRIASVSISFRSNSGVSAPCGNFRLALDSESSISSNALSMEAKSARVSLSSILIPAKSDLTTVEMVLIESTDASSFSVSFTSNRLISTAEAPG